MKRNRGSQLSIDSLHQKQHSQYLVRKRWSQIRSTVSFLYVVYARGINSLRAYAQFTSQGPRIIKVLDPIRRREIAGMMRTRI